MTDEDFQAWLLSPAALRVVLVEVGVYDSSTSTETTRYLSNRGYVTSPTDTPSNVSYLPIINGGISLQEKLRLDSDPSISWGDIEIVNSDGAYDSWLDDVWSGRPLAIYVGDATWPRADFVQIFQGVTDDISARSRDYINLKIRDKLDMLNSAMSEAKLGGTGPNKDALLPLCFGECHNVEPLLVDSALLKYKVHNGPIENIIEVRDNGAPVLYAATLATGEFTLAASPVGTITCSVQGAKPSTYLKSIANIISHIATNYGTTALSPTEIDTASFSAFDAAHPQAVGMYLDGKSNVLEVCNNLAASVGGQVAMTRLGKLQLLKVSLPTGTAVDESTQVDMLEKSLNIIERLKLKAASNIGYCKNWTVQQNLPTGLMPEHIELFAKEWLEAKVENSAVATLHKLSAEVDRIDTYLLTTADATAEAARRLAMASVQLNIVEFEAPAYKFNLKLGDSHKITHPRFGLSGGVTGQIVGLAPDWIKARVKVEVLL